MKKVYCKNCKWYKEGYCFNGYRDNTEENPSKTWKDNQCSNYKCKWWKFWVK